MGVADKNLFRAELRLVWVEPETKLGNVQITRPKFNSRKSHAET